MRKIISVVTCIILVFYSAILFAQDNNLSEEEYITTGKVVDAEFSIRLFWKSATVKQATRFKANINVKDKSGKTPLMWASSVNASLDIIETLINNGADLEIKNRQGQTALMLAVIAKTTNSKLISFLVKHGANIECKDRNGRTPLMWVARYETNPKKITQLVKLGANIEALNAYNETPLMLAAQYNKNVLVIKSFIELGANLQAKDKYHGTIYSHLKQNKKLQKTKAFRELKSLLTN